jgi:bifunctional DNA-binding transcriptional regulator/antitoxin component of YhaV-PrlF toxin-antitoxin module
MPCMLRFVEHTGEMHVSQRGQMSLPAPARHRWGLDGGGEVGYVDLGDAIVLIPGGVERARNQLLQGITDRDWVDARAGYGDQDLSTE